MRYFDYLFVTNNPYGYLLPCKEVRLLIWQFLEKRFGWKVQVHKAGNLIIRNQIPPIYRKYEQYLAKNSLKQAISAICELYRFLIEYGIYNGDNPIKIQGNTSSSIIRSISTTPALSGIRREETRKRLPYLYFCLSKTEWKPQFIDDPNLKWKLIPEFKELGDKIITRILFSSGARIGEVLDLRKSDWTSLYGKCSGAWSKNKGDGNTRVKILGFDRGTNQMMLNYVNHERQEYDRSNQNWNRVRDDEHIFLNHWGNPKSYINYYMSWQEVCNNLKIKIFPHQIRHWVVTMALQVINEEPSITTRNILRNNFISLMAWRNPNTIEIYDDHILKVCTPNVLEMIDKYIPVLEQNHRSLASTQVNEHVNEAISLEEEIKAFINQDDEYEEETKL
jgi:integrase